MTKPKNSKCYDAQKPNCDENPKYQIVTKLKISNCDKTQKPLRSYVTHGVQGKPILTIANMLKNLWIYVIKTLSLPKSDKIYIVTKLKKSNGDKTWIMKNFNVWRRDNLNRSFSM